MIEKDGGPRRQTEGRQAELGTVRSLEHSCLKDRDDMRMSVWVHIEFLECRGTAERVSKKRRMQPSQMHVACWLVASRHARVLVYMYSWPPACSTHVYLLLCVFIYPGHAHTRTHARDRPHNIGGPADGTGFVGACRIRDSR